MSTVDVQTSGDGPAVLPATVTDAIQASAAILAMCRTVLTQAQQSGLSAASYAAIAQAAAAAAQSVAQGAYKRTPVNDADYGAAAADIYVGYTAITAPRTVTLPLAASAVPGRPVIVADESGNCSSTNTIGFATTSSDVFVGLSSPPSIASGGATIMFYPVTGVGWVVR